MAIPRRLLPSVSLLRAFEAVVRTGSTLGAAQELSLTQGAVSRLIQSLSQHRSGLRCSSATAAA